MVPIITFRLKRWWFLYCISSISLHANWFDDAWSSVKDAANKVDKAFNEAGQKITQAANTVGDAIKDRFKDTKTTRAIDYGVRKAALEAALATAKGVLEAAKQTSTGTLTAAEKTAEAGLSAAEHFLSDVVRIASPAILRTSAQAAQGSLETVKKAGVGVLQGTQWVVNQASDLFDINRIYYQGDLRRLEKGIIGDVLCEGKAFGKPFSSHFDLDPRDLKSIEKSIEKMLKDFEQLFNNNVLNPITKAFSPLQQQIETAAKALNSSPPPNPAIAQAAQLAKNAADRAQKQALAEKSIAEALKTAERKLQDIAKKTTSELEDLVRKGTITSSSESALARQELVKRLKEKKG